jgi:hypothetical protein
MTDILYFSSIFGYSETLELYWNIEPNRTEFNRISLIEPNRIFSMFRCFFDKNHSNASNTPCKVIQMQ